MKNLNLTSILMISFLVSVLTSCNDNELDLKNKIEGKVKKETISLAPKVPGKIKKIYVKEGQTVNAGDTLAEIDIPEVEAKSMQAEGAYLAAKSQYEMAQTGATSFEREQINAKYEAAKSQFLLAEKSFTRIKNMMKDSLISQQKYDEVEEKYNAAKAQLDAVYAMKKDIEYGIRREKKMMAMGDMKRAEGVMQEVQSASNEKFIIAPKKFTIETIALREGELALAGYNLFVGYEPESIYFRFTISESKIANFKKDNVYNIIIPYMNNTIVKSTLVSIKEMGSYAKKTASYATYELGEAVYEVKFVPSDLKSTVDMEININMTALVDDNSKKS